MGAFGAPPTVLTKPDHIRELLQQMQAPEPSEGRSTREMDPAQFRALLVADHAAGRADAPSIDPDDDLAIPVAPEVPVARAAPVPHEAPDARDEAAPLVARAESSRPQLPVAPAPAIAWQTWLMVLIVAFGVGLGLLLAFGS